MSDDPAIPFYGLLMLTVVAWTGAYMIDDPTIAIGLFTLGAMAYGACLFVDLN